MAQNNRYTTSFKKHTSICILDNFVLKDPSDIEHLPAYQSILQQSLKSLYGEGYTKEKLKATVKKTTLARIKSNQEAVESSIHYFHRKIMWGCKTFNNRQLTVFTGCGKPSCFLILWKMFKISYNINDKIK